MYICVCIHVCMFGCWYLNGGRRTCELWCASTDGFSWPTLCVLLLGIYAKDANQCSAERGRQLTVKSRHTHAHSDAPLLLAASRFV